MDQRTCTKCGAIKPETLEFFRRRGTSDRGGLRPDCRECSAARDREFYAANREREKANRAEYRARTKAAAKIRDLAYARTDAGRASRARARSRFYTSEVGREVARQAASRRRAKARGNICDLTTEQWRAIVAEFGGRCAYCDQTPVVVTLDHIVAIDNGGGHMASNVVPACKSCNSGKFNHDVTDWFSRQEYFDATRLARVRRP